MTDLLNPFENKVKVGRAIALTTYFALIILLSFVNTIAEIGSIKLWLVQVIPLIILLPSLWSNSHRGYSWLCFVLLMYFTVTVVNVMSPPELVRWYHYVELILIVIMFPAAMMTSRWIQYWRLHQHNNSVSQSE